jgi:hypothetical protein
MNIRTLLGFAFILPGRRERFVPGNWTPRYDPEGRIYMLLAPDDKPAQNCSQEKP